MTEPPEMIEWMDRRIASLKTWLSDHGRRSKRPRPIHEIEGKEYDLAMFDELRVAYVRALERRQSA